MAGLAEAVRKQGSSGVRVDQPKSPLDIEAVWSVISTEMTTNDWATIAGTCRASWAAKLPQIAIVPGTPLAGVSKKLCT